MGRSDGISQTVSDGFFDLESAALRLDLMSSRKPIGLIFIYLLRMVRYTINQKMRLFGTFLSFFDSFAVISRSFRVRSVKARVQFHPSLLISTNFENSIEFSDEHSSVI